MRQQIRQLLAQKGQAPVYSSIDNSIRDLKRAQYTKAEVFDTIDTTFKGLDTKIDNYIEKQKTRFYSL